MAKMIPSEISYYDKKSKEDVMFHALSTLPNDYFVFHSYRVQDMLGGNVNESEADFLIYHHDYGCLIIEAKNGKVYRNENGEWMYQNDLPMRHDPFDQACTSMYNLKNKFISLYKNTSFEALINKCKFLYAVWFPSYTQKEINECNFGPNVVKELILPKEALEDTTIFIESIMKTIQKMHVVIEKPKIIYDANNYQHKLSKEESIKLFSNVFCPSFDIVKNKKKELEQETYLELLKEQYIVLDFLSEQKSASISGASGTGKTFVAIERARRLSIKGEKVLFLCYNVNLKNYLEANFPMNGVDFYTIDGFTCKKLGTNIANYYKLYEVLSDEISIDNFEYKHILIDEGQDFGREDIENSKVLDLLAEYGSKTDGCSFFIFYDKYQMVNSKQLPKYLLDVDAKLTLYKNCRNTIRIADTAYSLLAIKPNMYKYALMGEEPELIFYSSIEELEKRLNNLINKLSEDKSYDKVILTCQGLDNHSLINNFDKNKGIYKTLDGKKVKMYSCNTFKGLEEDYVILVDVNEKVFDDNNFTFYVGASRAKKGLYIFININDYELEKILDKKFPLTYQSKNKKKQITNAIHAKYVG